MFKISKSDYVLGKKCPLALYYKKKFPKLNNVKNDSILKMGSEVGELARQKYANGVLIDANSWTQEAIDQTKSIISKQQSIYFKEYTEQGNEEIENTYEATVETSNNEYCAVDILRYNRDGTYDLLEVKATTNLKDKLGKPGYARQDAHLLDLSFQRYVFVKAGINVNRCILVNLNKEYVRNGNLNLDELFKENDITDKLYTIEQVEKDVEILREFVNNPILQLPISKAKCKSSFYECSFMETCWKNVPKYSVFNAFGVPKCDKLYDKYNTADMNIIEERPKNKKLIDIKCNEDQSEYIDKDKLKEFLSELQYPLYYLDYESIQSAIPMFDGSSPYQQICFQFSLHVQRVPNGELEYYEYVHDKMTDPRRELVESLIKYCEKSGSVIVYNKSFECTRNKEMANLFPEYADDLLAINDRVIDLADQFKNRYIYSYKQYGSYSIKKTLPAFVPSMSYDNLGIHNGAEASDIFMRFMKGKLTNEESNKMVHNLKDYCGQDTLAMVKLLDVIIKYVNEE